MTEVAVDLWPGMIVVPETHVYHLYTSAAQRLFPASAMDLNPIVQRRHLVWSNFTDHNNPLLRLLQY